MQDLRKPPPAFLQRCPESQALLLALQNRQPLPSCPPPACRSLMPSSEGMGTLMGAPAICNLHAGPLAGAPLLEAPRRLQLLSSPFLSATQPFRSLFRFYVALFARRVAWGRDEGATNSSALLSSQHSQQGAASSLRTAASQPRPLRRLPGRVQLASAWPAAGRPARAVLLPARQGSCSAAYAQPAPACGTACFHRAMPVCLLPLDAR